MMDKLDKDRIINSEDEIYNIAIASNDSYIRYMFVLLQSIFETNKNKRFCFYILYNQLEPETISNVAKYIKGNGAEVEFVYIQGEKYDKFPTKARLTVETYFRLDVQDVLPQDINRLLYLDCDMIVCGDLDELYHTDFEGKYLAACGFSPKCECGSDFNAGMLLFNMPKMREDISFETYCGIADKLKGNYYLDQGLLNYRFAENDTLYVWKEKYNFTCSYYRKFKKEIAQIFPDFSLEDVVIMHFTGPGIRPWEMKLEMDEYESLKRRQVLPLLASKNYIIDDVYIYFLQKWWDIAKRTLYYEKLLEEMYQKKTIIYAEALAAVGDSKEYRIGNWIMKFPQKIKKIIKA